MRIPSLALLGGLVLPLTAQSNAVPGLDASTYDIGDATVYGHRGPAYPNGETGVNLGHSMCNAGTVHIPWLGISGGVMLQTYPKITSLLARESNGRLVQISGKSHCKHSRVAFNFLTGPCAPCQTGPTAHWRIGCGDIYSSGFSGLSTLGPTDEIDPWLGTWNPVGSYFDRGDPAVTGPAATDGVLSPITSSDPTYNRMIVADQDLLVPGTYWGQVQVVVIGEPVGNRGNNYTTREVRFTPGGGSFTGTVLGTAAQQSVLHRWNGASLATGQNGIDDGRFHVGWKVTGPVDGFWHYEFAVHNLDNTAGAAAFRLPICPTARVKNLGFHDIDRNPLNDWTASHSGSELAWLAPAGNALDWNTLYNFWFDCDAAPIGGTLQLDRARLGPGALSVAVAVEVPGRLGSETLAVGCGAPAPELFGSGLPSAPNPNYALQVRGPANVGTLFAMSFGPGTTPLGNGCVQQLDGQQLLGTFFTFAAGDGLASLAVPVPPGFQPIDLWAQAMQFGSGPLFGTATLSNGLRLRVGGVGCP